MNHTELSPYNASDVAQPIIGKDLEDCKCLNLCELRLILFDQLKIKRDRHPHAEEIIKESQEYASRFAKLRNRQTVLDVRALLSKDRMLSEFEMASLVNIFPRTPDEAKCLIPSLGRLNDVHLSQILDQLQSYRIFAR